MEKATDKGGEDWELRQGPAFRDISDAGEGRVMDKRDFCIQLSKSLPRLTGLYRTIVSGHKTLSPKLLHGRLGTMREEQHVPAAVSHLEDLPCQL